MSRRRGHRATTSSSSGRPSVARPMKSSSASVVGRHDARGAGIAEAPLDAQLLAERRAAAHLHRQVGHRQRRLGRRGLDLQHAQHRVGALRLERGQRVEQAARACVSVSSRMRAKSSRGPSAARPATWSRCARRVAVRCAAVSAATRLHQAQAEGGAQHLERRQHQRQRDVEPGAVRRPACAVGGHAARRRRDRRRAVAAQAQAVEAAGLAAGPARVAPAPATASSGRVAPPAAGSTRRSCRPAPAEVTQLFCASRRTWPSVRGGGAERRPEVAARARLGERQRAQVAAGGDRLAHVARRRAPRAPRTAA